MSREAETKVLGAIAEYIEQLLVRIDRLDAQVTDQTMTKEAVQSIVDARLDDYDPTQHIGFNDAARDAVDAMLTEAVSDAIGELEFECTVVPRTSRRFGR